MSNKDTVIIRGGNGASTNSSGSDLDINLVEITEPETERALTSFHKGVKIISGCMVIITIAVCIIALKKLFD